MQHHLETDNVKRIHRELNKISMMLQVSTNRIWFENTMDDKIVETLDSKIQVVIILETFSPLHPQTMLIFLFLRLHRPQRLQTLNWGAGGIRELTLDANKLAQLEVLNYRKASFSKSVSTFFVAHCRFGSLQEHSEG